jgi:hypothetical protein
MPKNKTAPAETAVETSEDEDYSGYLDKAPTDLQSRFTDWIKDKTEISFQTKKEEAAFDEGVRLGVALRMKFQASPENQAINGRAARSAARASDEQDEKPAKVLKSKNSAPAEESSAPVATPAKPKAAKKAAAGSAKAPF